MRRTILFTIAALCGVAASGQSLLDCLEPDVMRALLLQSQGERAPVITAAVPSEISALRMPRQFTWIGSAERITGRVDATTEASQVTAAWRISLAPEAALAAAATALTASGWEVRPLPGAVTRVFFIDAMLLSQQACRDGKPLTINASTLDGVTYVLATFQRGTNSISICNQSARPVAGSGSPLEKYLPRLEMPGSPTTGGGLRSFSSNSSYGGDTLNALVEFTMKDSAANISRHFAKQMADQGWSSDASWSGATSVGTSWSKRDGSALIQSTVSVAALDNQQFAATLRVLQLQ